MNNQVKTYTTNDGFIFNADGIAGLIKHIFPDHIVKNDDAVGHRHFYERQYCKPIVFSLIETSDYHREIKGIQISILHTPYGHYGKSGLLKKVMLKDGKIDQRDLYTKACELLDLIAKSEATRLKVAEEIAVQREERAAMLSQVQKATEYARAEIKIGIPFEVTGVVSGVPVFALHLQGLSEDELRQIAEAYSEVVSKREAI